ncbi:MAG: response regulator, partial [Lachnospiraceae bacterium]|nr:response regulator [Lachnospiraceae bacterium]
QMDGYEFCTILKKNPVTREIPVIFISALDTIQDKLKGLELGAVDFITKPFEATEVTMRVKNQLETRRMKQAMENFNSRLYKMLSAQMEKLENEKKAILRGLIDMVNERTGVPKKHLVNTKLNSRILAQSLQLSPDFNETVTDEFIENIGDAAILHNIGYLWDPEKEGHCERGVLILNNLLLNEPDCIFKEIVIDIAGRHHDDFAKKEDIPLPARISRVINDFDNLSYDLMKQEAEVSGIRNRVIEIMEPDSGVCYDPLIFNIFKKIQRQLHIDE